MNEQQLRGLAKFNVMTQNEADTRHVRKYSVCGGSMAVSLENKAPQSETKVRELLEKWNKVKNDDNFVYPWDWMFDGGESDNELDNTVINMKEMVIADSQEVKRKIEDTLPDTDNQLINRKKLCGLSDEQMETIKTLKKSLHEPENTSTYQDLLQFLNEMSIAQIEMLCDEISLSDLPQKALISLSKHINESNENLGINAMIILFRNMFLEKVYSLTQTPSQIFIDSIISLSKKYPRASCQGLAVNIVQACPDLEDQQLNLLTCLIQQSYTEDITVIFFQEFLKMSPKWNENWVKLVHNIISLKFNLGTGVPSSLNVIIDRESENMKKNLSFARLLQLFLNNYVDQLSQNDLLNLQKVVIGNESILKKQLANLVKKCIAK
uniref:Fanconi Anaemia group E protein C-terminal domain-containing protein n=1 Tax=Strigamia maritima TaxID=126957 RepID=T1IZX2_STRMM